MTNAATHSTSNSPANAAVKAAPKADATASEQFAVYAHDAINKVAEAAANAEVRLREATVDAEKSLKLKSGELKTRATDTMSRAEQVAKEKPLLVAGAALATGYLLGKMLGR